MPIVYQPNTIKGRSGRPRAIKEAGGLRGVSIMHRHRLRDPPPWGSGKTGGWLYIIYINIRHIHSLQF